MHNLTPAEDILHGDEELVYARAGYQVIEKLEEMDGETAQFLIAMCLASARYYLIHPMAS